MTDNSAFRRTAPRAWRNQAALRSVGAPTRK